MLDCSRRLAYCAAAVALCAGVAACTSPAPKASIKQPHAQAASKEYFSEAQYGVKASPRIATNSSNLRRGGGRYQVGKPYKIKGRWYRPKEDPDYVGTGKASWYGAAFHGRLTANGEVYDMMRLTAAHPTMPLPSYARVTNLENGRSVIVRVNDRGPFAHNRVIDLSKRAAELLDYTHSGVAKVKVEYAGRAPLEGTDDDYLLASYRAPDGAAPDQNGGVLVAMSGPTSEGTLPGVGATAALDRQAPVAVGASAAPIAILPRLGPLPSIRPKRLLPRRPDREVAALSYAPEPDHGSPSRAVRALSSAMTQPHGATASWGAYIYVGNWTDPQIAALQAARLRNFGRPVLDPGDDAGKSVSLMLYPNGTAELDAMLATAWQHGAPDAFIVRP